MIQRVMSELMGLIPGCRGFLSADVPPEIIVSKA